MSLTVANYNPLHCCWCRTEWTERYYYGSLELDRDDQGTYSPPKPGGNYVWHSTAGEEPQQNYVRINNRKIQAYEFIPLHSVSNCDCTNGSGGTALDKEEVYETTEQSNLENITKRFPGAWLIRGYNFANSPSVVVGNFLVAYMKTAYFDLYRARYYHMHWCGKTCPGAPLAAYRVYDKFDAFNREARNCKG
jgi:hypothetical protein